MRLTDRWQSKPFAVQRTERHSGTATLDPQMAQELTREEQLSERWGEEHRMKAERERELCDAIAATAGDSSQFSIRLSGMVWCSEYW